MKNTYSILACVALFATLATQCADPLENLNLEVGTDVLHYTTMLQIEDGKGSTVSGLNVTISGQDAEHIYNLSGRKQFTIQGGLLGLGVNPYNEPSAGRPVKFMVELSGAGFVTQKIPVTIASEQFQSLLPVNVLKISDAPLGVVVATPSVSLEGNSIPVTTVIRTPLSNAAAQSVSITLEAGTQFLDASGNVVSGGELEITLINADPSKESALSVFPGGKLTSDNVIAEGASQGSSGAFNPAGLVSIEFSVNGQSIHNFSKPIKLSMELDPGFINISTGEGLAAGDELDIYSYQIETAQWQFESKGIVLFAEGRPVLEFETDHLTWYMAGNFVSSCTQPFSANLTASWMQDGITYPFTVEATLGGKVIAASQFSVSTANNTVRLTDVPASGINIRVKDSRGEVLANVPVNSSCGAAAASIALSEPSVEEPVVTLQLYVRCPGQSQTVSVLPTFYLYYREAIGNNSEVGFKLLGVVENGFLSTTALTANTVEYDFKAVWNDEVKRVHNKTVTEDNSATVGTGSGDILGENGEAVNLDILRQKCSELVP